MAAKHEPRYVAAVLLILLLAGAEGARVSTQVDSLAAKRSIYDTVVSSDIVANNDLELGSGGGNDVCRLKDLKADPSSVLPRYSEKMEKLHAESEQLEQHPYSGRQWISVTRRLKRFSSCARMLQSKDIPEDLRSTMMHGDKQLQAGLLAPRAAVTQMLEEYDAFPEFEGLPHCRFGLMGLDLEALQKSSSPEETLRFQLFGEQCSLTDAHDYINSLSGKSRRIAKTMHNQLLKMMKLKKTAAGNPNSTEVKHETQDIIGGLRADLDDISEEAASLADVHDGLAHDDENSDDQDDVLLGEDTLDESQEQSQAEEEFLTREDTPEIDEELSAEEAQLLTDLNADATKESDESTFDEHEDADELTVTEDDDAEKEEATDSLLEVSDPKKKSESDGEKKKKRGTKSESESDGEKKRASSEKKRKSGERASRASRSSSVVSDDMPASPQTSPSQGGSAASKFLRIAVVILCLIAILTVVFLLVLHIFAVVAGVNLLLLGPGGGLLYTTAWLR